MNRKLVLLAAAALLSVGAAFAQGKSDAAKTKFYETVPKHEFFFEGFAGIAPLLYNVEGVVWGPTAAHPDGQAYFNSFPSDIFNWNNKTGIGYGGGFGYIWHFHPNIGLMLGAEFAVYNGGIRMNGGNHNEDYYEYAISAETAPYDGGAPDDRALIVHLAEEYAETQQYMAVQVPLMFQVMAPMGKGNNHFYFAFGAKAGFNVHSTFKASAERLSFYPLSTYFTDWANADEWLSSIPGLANAPAGEFTPITYMGRLNYIDVKDDREPYEAKGKLRPRLFNPMASAELGFRWKLGRGCGLYTGLYADYGFLSLMPAPKGGLVTTDNLTFTTLPEFQAQSILNSEAPPTIEIRNVNSASGSVREFRYGPMGSAASKVHSLHAGLKLKIAFGKVKKVEAPVIPVIPPKPDTVVKTVVQTIVVRDTVVRNNTVVVRDTVEKVNTVVVRDTVVVVKEIPQEIKDVMVELSNTLFAFNKFNLSDKAREGLNKVAGWLNDNPDVQVEISGHTDSVGSDSYNQKLSEQRAKSVYEYFIHEGGVSSKRLSYKGYGKSRPIASNDTEEGRQQNRRVELNIIQ